MNLNNKIKDLLKNKPVEIIEQNFLRNDLTIYYNVNNKKYPYYVSISKLMAEHKIAEAKTLKKVKNIVKNMYQQNQIVFDIWAKPQH